MDKKFAADIGLPSFEPEVNCGAYCYGGSVSMNPTTFPKYTDADECWVRGDVVLEAIEAKDAQIARLREALDTLTLVVGLTAFKHEGQRAPLQEAMDRARAALAPVESHK